MLSIVKSFFNQFCCCNFDQGSVIKNSEPRLFHTKQDNKLSQVHNLPATNFNNGKQGNNNQETILVLKNKLQDDKYRQTSINLIRSLLNLKAIQQNQATRKNINDLVKAQEEVAYIENNSTLIDLSFSSLNNLIKDAHIIHGSATKPQKTTVTNELKELLISLATSNEDSVNYTIFKEIQSDINLEVIIEIISNNNSAPYPLTETRKQYEIAVPSENQLCIAPETSPAIIKIRHSLAELAINKINNNRKPKLSYNEIELIFTELASLANGTGFHDLPSNNNELFKHNLTSDFIDFKKLLIENIASTKIAEFHQIEDKAAFIKNEILDPVLVILKNLIDEKINSPDYLQNGILYLAMKILQKSGSTFYRIKEQIEMLFSYFESTINNKPEANEFEVTIYDKYELSLDEESQKDYNSLKSFLIINYQKLANIYNAKVNNAELSTVESTNEEVKTPLAILKDSIINLLRTIVTNHLAAEAEKLANRNLTAKSKIEIPV